MWNTVQKSHRAICADRAENTEAYRHSIQKYLRGNILGNSATLVSRALLFYPYGRICRTCQNRLYRRTIIQTPLSPYIILLLLTWWMSDQDNNTTVSPVPLY